MMTSSVSSTNFQKRADTDCSVSMGLLANMPSCTVHVSSLEDGPSIDMQLECPREQGSCQGCSGLKKKTPHIGPQKGEFFFSSTRLKNSHSISLRQYSDDSLEGDFFLFRINSFFNKPLFVYSETLL